MNKIFFIYDKNNRTIVKTKENWCYNSLWIAKRAAKNYLDRQNKIKKPREERFFWTDYEIIECEPVELIRHKL